MNNTIPWPDDWPKYRNGGQLCDMKVGPCSCGATHQVGEFDYSFGILLRCNEVVGTGDTQLKPASENKMKNVTVLKRQVMDVYVPIIKDEDFVELKELEIRLMAGVDEYHNRAGDQFLIISSDGCKILLLKPSDFRPVWSEWGGEIIEV